MAVGIFLIAATGVGYTAEKAPQKVIKLAHSSLAKFGTDPIIVKAVEMKMRKERLWIRSKLWMRNGRLMRGLPII